MSAGVVLDTSFLITLADPDRTNHQTARRYWKYFTEECIPIFVPTIVVSEFCLRQEIPPGILRNCVVLPFNWDDAVECAKLDFSSIDRQGESRAALKDDVKIIAQAIVKEAAFVITDDQNSFHRFALRVIEKGRASFRAIKLADGFDRSFFDANGQRDFDDALDENDDDADL
jgi:hypothetical protein